MKILVRSPNWIGDQVLAYPFFYFLRKKYPQAKITSLCVPWVESIQFRGLVDEVITLPKVAKMPGIGGFFQAKAEWDGIAANLLPQGPWDLAFVLPPSLSSAWLAKQLKIPKRIGGSGEFRRWLGMEVRALKGGAHRADAYVALLDPALGRERKGSRFFGVLPVEALKEDEGEPGEQSVFPSQSEWGPWISAQKEEIVEPPSEPYWVLAPGSVAASRRWDRTSFVQLARGIAERGGGMRGVVIGGPGESVLADELCSYRELKLVNRTAQGSVAGLAPLLAGARFAVANDSGLAHVAALCGATTYVIWGAGNPKHTAPIGPGRVRLTLNPISCWPCERNTCALSPMKQNACLKGISAEMILKELREL